MSSASVTVGTKANSETGGSAEYITQVDGARVKLIAFVVNENKKNAWASDMVVDGNANSEVCDFIDGRKQCDSVRSVGGDGYTLYSSSNIYNSVTYSSFGLRYTDDSNNGDVHFNTENNHLSFDDMTKILIIGDYFCNCITFSY